MSFRHLLNCDIHYSLDFAALRVHLGELASFLVDLRTVPEVLNVLVELLRLIAWVQKVKQCFVFVLNSLLDDLEAA